MLALEGTSNKDYIEFRHGNGCYSIAGREGGRQFLTLAPFCAEEHTLIHEVYFVIYQNTVLTILSDLASSWSIT